MTASLTEHEKVMLSNTIIEYRSYLEAEEYSEAFTVVGQLVFIFCNAFGKNPLKAMQECFDHEQIPIKILAIPVENVTVNRSSIRTIAELGVLSVMADSDIGLPGVKGAEHLPYYAYMIAGERVNELHNFLEILDVTENQNLARLALTGVYLPREGTNTNKAIMANLN